MKPWLKRLGIREGSQTSLGSLNRPLPHRYKLAEARGDAVSVMLE